MTCHYLDNSATTPLSSAAKDAMKDVMEHIYGNPSSLHTLGLQAEKVVSAARESVLAALCPSKSGIYPKKEQLIFTASGTEANNLALTGTATAKARNKGKKIIIGETEHPSIIETARHLSALGYTVVQIPAPNGIWDMTRYEKELTDDTILVSAMLVNNETGAVNDLEAIAAAAKKVNPNMIVHCDAVQGFLKLEKLPVAAIDMITVSAHKIGGPKGIGALYVTENILKTKSLVPVIFGGGQERGFRSGTENVIGIAGFGAAASAGAAELPAFLSRMTSLRTRLERGITNLPVRINQPWTKQTAAHIISLTVPGIRSETLLHSLSSHGVYISSGSACSSNTRHASYVLRSFGLSDADADSTIRISLGRDNTETDIDAFCEALTKSLHTLAKIKK